MAKIKVSCISFLIVLACFCAVGQNNLRQCVKDIYTSQIGVREKTGHNNGKAIEFYLQSTGLNAGHAWCAAFVNWCFLECNIKTVKSPAWSPSWANSNIIYKPSKSLMKVFPLSADVFTIYYQSKGRVAHTGFIDEWTTGDFCITVEGNTNTEGSREGDGVYKKRRIKRQIYTVSRFINYE